MIQNQQYSTGEEDNKGRRSSPTSANSEHATFKHKSQFEIEQESLVGYFLEMLEHQALKIVPLKRDWSRKFKPHLPAVKSFEQKIIRTIRYDYSAKKHIPREAGLPMPLRAPRTRTCARAYQMFGYCHLIAPVMMKLAELAMPRKEWFVLAGRAHSTVISNEGDVVDINQMGRADSSVLRFIEENCFVEPRVYTNLELCLLEYTVAPLETSVSMNPRKDMTARKANQQQFWW